MAAVHLDQAGPMAGPDVLHQWLAAPGSKPRGPGKAVDKVRASVSGPATSSPLYSRRPCPRLQLPFRRGPPPPRPERPWISRTPAAWPAPHTIRLRWGPPPPHLTPASERPDSAGLSVVASRVAAAVYRLAGRGGAGRVHLKNGDAFPAAVGHVIAALRVICVRPLAELKLPFKARGGAVRAACRASKQGSPRQGPGKAVAATAVLLGTREAASGRGKKSTSRGGRGFGPARPK